MANYPRMILQLVATAGVAVMLSTATPASAAETAVPAVTAANPTVTVAKSSPHAIRHFASRRTRIAASRYLDSYVRRVSALHRDLGCSGEWCGRQFVLMVGVGF
jgi:hypothetical protein